MNKFFIMKLLLIISLLSYAAYLLLSEVLENFGYIDIYVTIRMLFVFSLPIIAVVADEILKNKKSIRQKESQKEALEEVRQHLKGATFIFDTSYLVTCANYHNYLKNIFESESITKIIPDFVIDELDNCTKAPSTKAVKNKNFKAISKFLDELPEEAFIIQDATQSGDEGLIALVNQYENAYLCTFDTAFLDKVASGEYDINILSIEVEMAFGINELY